MPKKLTDAERRKRHADLERAADLTREAMRAVKDSRALTPSERTEYGSMLDNAVVRLFRGSRRYDDMKEAGVG